jgi:hypothetical protein
MSSSTPHRFDDPLWEFGDILGSLMNPDPAKFGRFLTAEDYRSEHRRAQWYQRRRTTPLDKNPAMPLPQPWEWRPPNPWEWGPYRWEWENMLGGYSHAYCVRWGRETSRPWHEIAEQGQEKLGRWLEQRERERAEAELITDQEEATGNPARTLLHALQRGELTAFDRQGKKLSKHHWYGMTEKGIVNGVRQYVVEREEILRWRPRLAQQERDQEAAAPPLSAADNGGDTADGPDRETGEEGASTPIGAPSSENKPMVRKRQKETDFKAWFDQKCPGGIIPANLSIKGLWRDYCDETKLSIGYSTARRALGLKK